MYTSMEDKHNVKLYLLLPLVLSAFDRDIRLAEKAFKTPEPYVKLIEQAMDKVHQELKEVRQYMRTNGIKVYEELKTDKAIQAKYLCKGYHSEMHLLWSTATASCRILMEKYLGLDVTKYKNPAVPMELQQFDI
ncbi:hypothetical protein J2Z32_003450 [Paenibacillus turicensis]|uniref:Uncharacterized protein n=1 Tax=Paenibacillus turicensis TaxID=160487 RepID=A0ABS4FW25_9BACL|nr:hypothetical protein [Paenibacillus turicensis]MBP1906786.1 hypothetical protein [Paenibacillus turicensis]